MAYEQKPGDVIIFKNEKKSSENSPDYKGTGRGLDGAPIEIALWLKQGAKGKFMAGSIKPKRERE